MPRVETLITDPRGRIQGVDPRRLYEMPYALLTNPPNNFVAIGANATSPKTALTVSGEGPILIRSFAAERLGACRATIQIQDGSEIHGLSNRGVHLDTIFGNGQLPFLLPEALYIDELRTLMMTFTDLSGLANSVAVNLSGCRFLALQVDAEMELIRQRNEQRQYLSTPYFYTPDIGPVTIPAGGVINANITVGQQHHFQLHCMTVVATSMAFNLNVIDLARGEALIDAPNNTTRLVAAGAIVGNANFPYRFETPRWVNYGQKLQLQLQDRSGAPNTVWFTLGGRAVSDKMWR